MLGEVLMVPEHLQSNKLHLPVSLTESQLSKICFILLFGSPPHPQAPRQPGPSPAWSAN